MGTQGGPLLQLRNNGSRPTRLRAGPPPYYNTAMPIQSINPATGELLASFAPMTAGELDAILTAAFEAQKAWARTPFAERSRLMRRAAALLRERAADLAKIAALEMGKPLKDGVAEVNKCALACEHYAEQAERYLAIREVRTDASRSFVRFDPLGVILAVMPWNFPFWQVFRFAAPNLMGGNGAVLKHASNVPQCALAIEALLRDAGFPKDLFRTVLVESKGVGGLISDPRIAAVTLTGSDAAGRAVAEAAGKMLKPTVLELGGSDPFIVLKDADVRQAAEAAAIARTINSGQSCIAAKRFIVEAPVYNEFVEGFVAAMKKLKVGDPLDPSTDLGPQARRDLRDQLHRQVEETVRAGARCVLGGRIPPGPGAYYPCTVLVDVPPDSVAAREETFGPVGAVLRAADEEEAVALANRSRYGLGASVWSRDPGVVDRIVPRIEAGSVFVNAFVRSDPRLPFGGIKNSGFGRELGEEGIRALMNVKTVWVR